MPEAPPGGCTRQAEPRYSVEVDRCIAALAASFLALLPARAWAVEILLGPFLQSPGQGTVVVVWETDVPAPGKVLWGEGGTLSGAVADPAPARRHEVALPGIVPGASVSYRVLAGTAHSRVATFLAPPRAGEDTRFIILGDTRTMHAAHRSVVESASTWASHFLVDTGDMVGSGDSACDWAAFFAIERPLLATRLSFHVIGNHDRAGGGLDALRRLLVQPPGNHSPESEFAVDIGNVRLIVLDNAVTVSDGASQEEWLEEVLEEAGAMAGIMHVIVAVHHGVHSNGPHGPSKSLWKAGLPGIMREHGVELVVAGHDHGYERGVVDGLRYMVTAGGGAPLYSKKQKLGGDLKHVPVRHHVRFMTEGEKLSFEVVLADGTVLESCSLAPMPKGFSCK